jgi:hypothetical protein
MQVRHGIHRKTGFLHDRTKVTQIQIQHAMEKTMMYRLTE